MIRQGGAHIIQNLVMIKYIYQLIFLHIADIVSFIIFNYIPTRTRYDVSVRIYKNRPEWIFADRQFGRHPCIDNFSARNMLYIWYYNPINMSCL